MGFALTVVTPWHIANTWLQLYAQAALFPLTAFNAIVKEIAT